MNLKVNCVTIGIHGVYVKLNYPILDFNTESVVNFEIGNIMVLNGLLAEVFFKCHRLLTF